MKVVSISILVLMLTMVGWIGFTFVHAWMTETGSWWQRTLKAGKDSATIVWSKLVIIAGGLVVVLDRIAALFGDPSLSQQIQSYVTPQLLGYVTVGIMVINVWARLRTLGN